jgi:hypothetical protein
MSTFPTPSGGGGISVTAPLGPAFERMKQILFQPFDLKRWLAIGFCAWLATLGERGGAGGVNYAGSGPISEEERQALRRGVEQVQENLTWIIPLVLVGVAVVILLALLAIWLSSRGRFMFLDNVATGRAEVAAPWRRYARHGNALALFRLGVALAGLLVFAPLALGVIAVILPMVRQERASFWGVALVVLLIGAAILAGIVFALIGKFTKDFVVPIMRLHTPSVLGAWGEFFRLFASHIGAFTLYILFHILLSVAIGMATLALVIATCCVAGCLMAIPYIGVVLILPVPVFLRAYSAGFLAQFGPRYDVFAAAGREPSA